MARPNRSVLQEGSKGPLPEGAFGSQPLAWGSMDQAVSMPHCVRIYSASSPIHRLPCQHPPCKASTLAVTFGALSPVTPAVRVHSSQHCAIVPPVLRL